MTLEDFDDHQLPLVGMSVLSKNHLCVIHCFCQCAQLHTTREGSYGDVPVLKFLLQPDANI